jgi:hypothetical protein
MASKTAKTTSAKRPRPSARALAKHADRILADTLEHEREYASQGMSCATLSRAELIRKLSGRTAHSPFLTQISWGPAVRGSSFGLNFGLMNPDSWPYEIGNLGLCFCYSDAGSLTELGLTLLRADPSIGVRQVEIGILNASPMPYYLPAAHSIPAGFRLGPADVNYFLYAPDPFAQGVLLERGTIRVEVT